jgi:DNA repair protein RecO
MRKQTHFSDDGLVLKKSHSKDHNHLVTLFTHHHGKLLLTAYGTKKLTSRRISHLETGNVIALSWRGEGEFMTLEETDLKYAHSQIKESSHKLDAMYLIFFVLNRILPENQPEVDIYDKTLIFLRSIHAHEMRTSQIEEFFNEILAHLGFIDQKQVKDPSFDTMSFIEGLIGRKLDF